MYCKKTASFSGEIFKENFTDIFYTNLEQIAFSIAFPIKNSIKRKAEKKPKAKISLHIKIGDYLSSGDKIGEKENNISKHHYSSVASDLPSTRKRLQVQIKDKPVLLTRGLTEGHHLLANRKFARRFDLLAPCQQLQSPSYNSKICITQITGGDSNCKTRRGGWAWPRQYQYKFINRNLFGFSQRNRKKMISKGHHFQFVRKKTNFFAYKSSYKSTICTCTPSLCVTEGDLGMAIKYKCKANRVRGPLCKKMMAMLCFAKQGQRKKICKPKAISKHHALAPSYPCPFGAKALHRPKWVHRPHLLASTNQRFVRRFAPVIYKSLTAHNKYKDNFQRFALTRKKLHSCRPSTVTFGDAKRSFVKRSISRFVTMSQSKADGHCKPTQKDLYGMSKGQKKNRTPLMLTSSGRVVMISKNQLVLQKTQPVLFYDSAKLHVKKGEFVLQGAPLLTLTHQTLITGDIVQGIPRIEQLFEAFTSPQKGLKDKKRLNVHDTLHSQVRDIFRKNWLKNVLSVAVRKSLEEIGSILLELIQKVYLSQGVLISDKHIEIIIRQMTSKGQILDSGSTGLLLEEVLPIRQIENANITTPGKKCLYVPSVVGLTAAALTCDSFISAASFQETTRVLSRDAVVGKTDFLRGLKEKVVIGDLISAGTGLDIYFVYTLFSESISYVQQSKTVNE